MTLDEAREHIGDRVAYHPAGAGSHDRDEHGVITGVGALVFVRYGDNSQAQATYPADLTLTASTLEPPVGQAAAIKTELIKAQAERDAAQRVLDRWARLALLRRDQVAAGEWPVPAERGGCTPACWTPVACPSCGNQLPPRGRSMPLAMGGLPACCDAARMDHAANPRHLWNEEEANG